MDLELQQGELMPTVNWYSAEGLSWHF